MVANSDPVRPLSPYYEDGNVTLYLGDALEILPALRSASFGAVLLDPPYAMAPVSVAGKDDGAAGASGSPIGLLSETAKESQRLLRDGGIAAIISDWRRVPDVSYLLTLHGLRLTSCVAWTRTTVGTGGMFRSAWDPVLIASKGQPTILDKAGIPNVVMANPPRDRIHPYEKPPALWSHILRRIPRTVVLDPFAGSLASAVAAVELGFEWVGIEVGERHAEMSAKRLSQGVLDFEGGAA